MRRIVLLVLLSIGLPAMALVSTAAAEAERGRVTIDASYIARLHAHHGHRVVVNGHGTPHHTWTNYQRAARNLRIYLQREERNRRRAALVARWRGVADCESGGNWRANTGNGHYGGLQFSAGTWRAYGGPGLPHTQPAWQQAEIAERVRTDAGLAAWPHCGRRYG
jgi:hypothetical protein